MSKKIEQKPILIQSDKLPLSCPLKDSKLWDAHPKVYLPIEPGQTVHCPYCSAAYTLEK